MIAADQQFFNPAANDAAMREYEARCCCVCQHRHPSFGFGPPLTRGGGGLDPADELAQILAFTLADFVQCIPELWLQTHAGSSTMTGDDIARD